MQLGGCLDYTAIFSGGEGNSCVLSTAKSRGETSTSSVPLVIKICKEKPLHQHPQKKLNTESQLFPQHSWGLTETLLRLGGGGGQPDQSSNNKVESDRGRLLMLTSDLHTNHMYILQCTNF